jgi:hypothetical protein
MYLQNKYTRWYYNIIQRAKSRKLPTDVYIEKHHIVPRSLGGDNQQENIVSLTAKEHFICHMLLVKMTTGKSKRSMAYAAWQMTNIDSRQRYSPTSRIYSLLKKNLSETYKGVPKTKIHWLGKSHSTQTKTLQSEVKKSSNNPMWGKKHKKKSKETISEKQKGIPKPKFVCSKCQATVGGMSNLLRWHEDNCPCYTIR